MSTPAATTAVIFTLMLQAMISTNTGEFQTSSWNNAFTRWQTASHCLCQSRKYFLTQYELATKHLKTCKPINNSYYNQRNWHQILSWLINCKSSFICIKLLMKRWSKQRFTTCNCNKFKEKVVHPVLSAGSKKRATCEEGGSCDSLCRDQPHFIITFTSLTVVSESVQTQPHFLLENRNVPVKKAEHNVIVDIKARNLDSAMLIHWLNWFFAKDSKEHVVCSAHSVWANASNHIMGFPLFEHPCLLSLPP